MKTKLELDFHYQRFWTFSLLAATLASALAYWSLKAANSPGATQTALLSGVLFVCFIIFLCIFNRTYSKLRKELS